MTPNEYCRDKAAPIGSALYYATRYLDAPRAEAIISLYALRAELEAVVRNCEDIEPARMKLAWWHAEILACDKQRANHPVTQALTETLARFPIGQSPLLELAAGFEEDLYGGGYADFDSLEHHCRHVSATLHEAIGATILGCESESTRRFAHDSGIVLQLGDVLRNVGRDARAGRIYLPAAEMRQFNVNEDDIFSARHGNNVKALLAFQLKRIRALREASLKLLHDADRKAQRALLALLAIRMATLDEIERDGFHVLDRRLALTPLRKFWIATKTWRRP